MAKARLLTEAFLHAVKATDKEMEYSDSKVPGLRYAVQPSNARSWVYRFRTHGKSAQHTIGRHPPIGLRDARGMAQEAAVDVAKGVDPRARKLAAKAAAKEAAAPKLDGIENVVTAYIERYAKKQTRERSWRECERLLQREIVGPWRGRSLAAIRRSDVKARLAEIADRGAPVVANRVLSALHRLCNWALEEELIEANPCTGVRAPSKETPRERTLDDGELRALWAATGELGAPLGPLVRMLLLTGCRVREVSKARWSEVDFAKAVLVLPAARAKNHRTHEVCLSPQAIEILAALPRFEKCDYVFTHGRAPVNGFSVAKRRLDIAMAAQLDGAELMPFVLHDLRRTVATGLAKLGVDLHVIERCLNHVGGTFGGIVSVYQKHKFEEGMRRAFDAWGAHIERLATGAEAAGNVVQLRDAALA